MNPHSWIYINVKKDDGAMEEWAVEGGTPNTLLRRGITRDSLLTVAKDLGYEASTTRISVEDWRRAAEAGEITEAFACGTAAVITPIGLAKSAQGEWNHGDGQPGEVTMKLRAALTGIQAGTQPDTHHWMRKLR